MELQINFNNDMEMKSFDFLQKQAESMGYSFDKKDDIVSYLTPIIKFMTNGTSIPFDEALEKSTLVVESWNKYMKGKKRENLDTLDMLSNTSWNKDSELED